MTSAPETRAALWRERLEHITQRVAHTPTLLVEGRVTRMVGLTLEASGCPVPVGGLCRIVGPLHGPIDAEVIGFSGQKTFLMPVGEVHGITPNAGVVPAEERLEARVGEGLLGRVVDGNGRPLDHKGPLICRARLPLAGHPINPLERSPIRHTLDVGIRAINGLCTVGRGQRLGLFASSGVGKSVLLGMMTRYTEADVIVVGLIGERGREIREFTDNVLGTPGLGRAVVVATPADDPPLMRVHGAMLATAIAEYFCRSGKNVLLLMDSLTRFAQAHREIGLAIGEPPTTKGYPPSVFAALPRLVERAGNVGGGSGSITAFYTVLTEEDATQDPVAEAARAILDGHIVLSRQLAERGHFPAIDLEASISRAMSDLCDAKHLEAARRFRRLSAIYAANSDLINIGAYAKGSDASVDEAIHYAPRLAEYLQQGMAEAVAMGSSIEQLHGVLRSDAPVELGARG